MAAPLTCTDLHAVLSVEEETLSVLCVSLCCLSTTLESSEDWVGEGDLSNVLGNVEETGNNGSRGIPDGIVFVLASTLRFLSFDVPITTLDSLFSKRSSVFKLPAAPGNGGKLDKPNSKLGDGGFGGGGDCVWPLVNLSSLFFR